MRNYYPSMRLASKHQQHPKEQYHICACGAKFRSNGGLRDHLVKSTYRYWEHPLLHEEAAFESHGTRFGFSDA